MTPEPAAEAGREAGHVHVAALTDLEQIRALRPDWQALVDKSAWPNVFLTWEWVFACCEHWARGASPLVLTIEREGRLLGIFPLVALGAGPFTDSGPRRRLRFATPALVDEYADVLCLPGHEREVVCASLQWLAVRRGSWHSLELCRVPSATPTLQLLRDPSVTGRAVRVVEHLIPASWCVTLPNDWDSLLQRSSRLKRVAQYVRRAVRETGARLEVLEEPDAITAGLPTFFELHAKRWQKKEERSVFVAAQPLWAAVAPVLAQAGLMQLFLLRNAEGSAMAGWLACPCRDRFFSLQTGFDPRFEDYKVGSVLLAMVMEFAIRRGYRQFDFLGGDVEYKRHWSDHSLDKTTLVLYPLGAAGWLAARWDSCRERARLLALRIASYERRRQLKRRLLAVFSWSRPRG